MSILKQKYDSYPEDIRSIIYQLRSFILGVAEGIPEVGNIEETLRWNELAFITSETKTGTPIRVDWKASHPNTIFIYMSCNTTLIDSFKKKYGDNLKYQKSRAIMLDKDQEIPYSILKDCIESAFLYKKRKRNRDAKKKSK